MTDKRFDTTPKGKQSVVREHRRKLESGLETTVRRHLRRVGLELYSVNWKGETSEIREIDIAPIYVSGEDRVFHEGYILQENAGFVRIIDKGRGQQVRVGQGQALTGTSFEDAIEQLTEYIDMHGISYNLEWE